MSLETKEMKTSPVVSSSRLFLAACGCFVLLFAGCGGTEGPKIVPVVGLVTIGGKPADNIMVRFVPDGESLEGLIESSGVSDADGRVEFMTSDNRKGAVPGPGKILVTDLLEERPAQGEVAKNKPRFPPSYGILGPVALTGTVAEGVPLEVEIPVQ
jgi:hypothetical protein